MDKSISRFSAAALCAAALLMIPSARLSAADAKAPFYIPPCGEGAYVLTPKDSGLPRINGASVFGVRPGSPFLFSVAASGARPMSFSAEGLPEGLSLNAADGRISGVIKSKEPRSYEVALSVSNGLGRASGKLKIVVGDAICLTPPMGWNSWNCWAAGVSQEKVLSSASAMVEKGLASYGWTYVNIDDGWQGARGGEFNAIQPNRKFPDIKALAGRIHGMGLKFGVYSTPWKGSYAGYIGGSCDNEDGSYAWMKGKAAKDSSWRVPKDNYSFGRVSFAKADAAQWAAWGVDFLKYDWNPLDVEHVSEMSSALRGSGRDIAYSLSNSASFQLAGSFAALASLWRTTGDITDTWESVSRIGFSQDRWGKFAGPGHWNDPDMLVVGKLGWGRLRPTKLTPDEQYSHLSLWCLLAAPLLLGCDLSQLDEFTLALLSNPEVLAIDQDALGSQGHRVKASSEQTQVWAKPLEDSSLAVGLFNLAEEPQAVSFSWSELGLSGPCKLRDLWRRSDIGVFQDGFQAEVRPHGVVLLGVASASDDAAISTSAPNVKWLPKPPSIACAPAGSAIGDARVGIAGASGAEIHYTLDGKAPTKASPLYSGPFLVDISVVDVKAVSVIDGESSLPACLQRYVSAAPPPPPDVKISSIPFKDASVGWGALGLNRSAEDRQLSIGGKLYESGLGVHARSEIVYALDPSFKRFVASVGVDDETNGNGSVRFEVKADGRTLARTPLMKGRSVWHINVPMPAGAKELSLIVDDGGDGIDYDHADWASCGFMK